MALSSQKFCDICGAANRTQAQFCRVCGGTFSASGSGRARVATTVASNGANQTPVPNHNTPAPQTQTGTLAPHVILKQRYMILSNVGRGGFGAVYKALDTQFSNRSVAVKEMSQNSLPPGDIPAATEAFNHEAHLLAGLTHPNLPRIYEQFTDQGRSYLVMDFIEGETLEEAIKRLGEGRMPIEKVLAIGLQLCSVLEYLHTRQPPIIFRDLKPSNVMLTPGGHVYLIDFGIARHFKPGQKRDTTALGSSGYAPPEQYGKSQTTTRADIYSLGATLHQLLSGDDPSESPFHFSYLHFNDPLLEGLDALVTSMVSVEINKRPETSTHVRQELHRIMSRYVQERSKTLDPTWSGTLPVAIPAIAAQSGPVTPPPAVAVPQKPAASTTGKKRSTRQTGKAPVIYPQINTRYICQGHSGRLTGLAWSPDGKYIASASYDQTVRVWNAATGKHVLTYAEHTGHVNAIAWSPDSQRLASSSDDQSAHIWEATTGKQLLKYAGHSGPVNAISWACDGRHIATGGDDKSVQVWLAETGELVKLYDDHTSKVICLAWSPDSKYLASGGKDYKLKVREYAKTQQKRSLIERMFFAHYGEKTFHDATGPINDLAWSPDSRHIVTVSGDYAIRLHNIHSNNVRKIGEGWNTIKQTVALSASGKHVAFGGNDKVVRIWNVAQNKETFIYYGHSGYVMALAWSPDGSLIASGSVDRTIQVWQAV